ncbi:unnamed protein product [Leptidea sinapis]|uniref:Uncharacterized protein n=1 Tax=Leptidea sinapis TaxID=189913 RepID=A0A5E4R0T5_9NEOP|nr:unnamed protein product [Leptidea sinapis]
MWIRCQQQAAERRSRLESAVGHQIFSTSSAQLQDWLQVRERFKEVIGLGKQLLATNPALVDARDKIEMLDNEQRAVKKVCAYYLTASSVDEAETLVKRQEEAEARFSAQDERVNTFAQKAAALAEQRPEHYAVPQCKSVMDLIGHHVYIILIAVSLHAELQCFSVATKCARHSANAGEHCSRTLLINRELANLERKLQKHEAFERELQANEKQLRNVESIGQSLQKSDPGRAKDISSRLEQLQQGWEQLVAASRDKGSKLRQASQQKQHRRGVEDAKARLNDLERALNSEDIGTDLRSCKRLLTQHQALEQELNQIEQRAESLGAQGADLVSSGHFDGAAIQRECAGLSRAVTDLRPRAVARRRGLDDSLLLHKLAAEVSGEIAWVEERRATASSTALPQDLHAAQSAQKKHAKLRSELDGRRPIVTKVLQKGREVPDHPQAEKIKQLCKELERAYSDVSTAAEERAVRLENALKAQQFMHDALEVDSWLADKAAELASSDVGNDRHRATQLLTRHKAVELELDTYAAIIAEMGHAAHAQSDPSLVDRHGALSATLARLQRSAALRQAALVESVCREKERVNKDVKSPSIQAVYRVLRSKFEELRHRVESGAERFSQCEELAKKLLASNSPYIGKSLLHVFPFFFILSNADPVFSC